MSDCQNIEMRERLPELLHGALPAGERRQVEAHVAGCAECAAELELLRTVMAVERSRPMVRIDTQAILRRLPAPPVARRTSRPMWSQWRVAAAITVVALGGMSLAVVRQYFGAIPVGDTVAVVAPASPVPVGPTSPVVDSPAATLRNVTLTAGGGVSDLGDDELMALIGALDEIDAAPRAEPDSTSFIRIGSGETGGN